MWLPPAKFRNGIWGVSHGHPALRKQRWWCAAKGRCGHRPLRIEGEATSTTWGSGAERSVCGADGRNEEESEQRSPPKGPATPDNPSVSLRGTGDANCHVGPAGLLAMTMVFCHSEERSDVGIRPFLRWTGVRAAVRKTRGTARRGRRPLRKVYRSPSNGPMYLRHGFRRPNFVPKFGASVRSSAPTENLINHPSQPARSEASAPAWARDGRESAQEPSPKGTAPATTPAALSEAESAERTAGQIRFLPDDLRVQHGAEGSEVSAKPRPCPRRGCITE